MLQFMQLIHAVAVQQRRPGFLVKELTTQGPLAARYHASSTDNLHRSSIDGSVARISGISLAATPELGSWRHRTRRILDGLCLDTAKIH